MVFATYNNAYETAHDFSFKINMESKNNVNVIDRLFIKIVLSKY